MPPRVRDTAQRCSRTRFALARCQSKEWPTRVTMPALQAFAIPATQTASPWPASRWQRPASCTMRTSPPLEIPEQRWLTFPDTTNIVAAFWVIQTQNPALPVGRTAETYDFHRNMQTGELWDQTLHLPGHSSQAQPFSMAAASMDSAPRFRKRAPSSPSPCPAPVAANTLSCDRSIPCACRQSPFQRTDSLHHAAHHE